MGDRIDDLMTKRWSDLKKQVACGLDVKPSLDKYVPIEPVSEARPYRQVSITWEEEFRGSVLPELSRCLPKHEGALELSLSLGLAVEALEDDFDQVCETVKALARKARRRERQALLLLIDKKVAIPTPYTLEKVKEGAASLSRPCRLIVISGDETAKQAVKQGVVEDSIDPQVAFPAGVVAMLLQLGDGPRWRRVVDDLTPTWQRQSATQVQLRLSERFFLDNADRAIKFA